MPQQNSSCSSKTNSACAVTKAEPFTKGMICSPCDLNVPFEDASGDAFLPPDGAGFEQGIGVKTGHLGAGAGAAGRAVITLAGAKDKVAAVRGRIVRLGEEFDVVDFRAVFAGNALRVQALDGCAK